MTSDRPYKKAMSHKEAIALDPLLQHKSAFLNVPFFFKQWGGVRKKEAGRELFGTTYDEMPIPHLRQNAAPLPVEADSILE